jgi:hypothetical protein
MAGMDSWPVYSDMQMTGSQGKSMKRGVGKGLTTDTSDAHNHCILITFVINCIILNKYFNEKYCFIMTQ